MTKIAHTGDRGTKWLRWVGRGIGSLMAAGWLLTGIVSALFGREPWTWESTAMAALILIQAVGVLIAWWREGVGGAIVLAGAVAFSTFAYFSAGHNRLLAVLVSGGPFLVASVSFLTAWWRSRNADRGS